MKQLFFIRFSVIIRSLAVLSNTYIWLTYYLKLSVDTANNFLTNLLTKFKSVQKVKFCQLLTTYSWLCCSRLFSMSLIFCIFTSLSGSSDKDFNFLFFIALCSRSSS